MGAEWFLKRSGQPAFAVVWTKRDLTAKTQRILSSRAGGSIGAARSSFIRSHCCWNARGLEDVVDARLHQLGNQGHTTDRKKALLIKTEVTNQENTTVQLTCSTWTRSKTEKWILYPISTTTSRKTPKTWFNSGNITAKNCPHCNSKK